MEWQRIRTDVLVVGGGGAGVRAAIAADDAGASVLLLCKGIAGKSGASKMAYPAINAAFNNMNDGDCKERYFEDFVIGGHGLCDEDLALTVAESMPDRIHDLEHYGVRFEKNEDGSLAQIQHPGHTCARTLIMKDGGAGMMRGLCGEMKKRKRISVMEDVMVLSLITDDKEHIIGAAAIDSRHGCGTVICAKAVILAGGGYEAMWQHTDVSADVTGDTLMLAYDAGAPLIDLEMILYYPFVGCSEKGRGVMLQYESLVHPQRFCGKMTDAAGTDLLGGILPPPRDEMLRIIEKAVNEGHGGPNGGVFLDLSESPLKAEEMDKLAKLYFGIPSENLRLQGIDLSCGKVEVKPGLHYSLGGIRIHAECAAGPKGLFACGECTGNLHGSNRLSGNALAETQAFGFIAGRNAAEYAATTKEIAEDSEAVRIAVRNIEETIENMYKTAPITPVFTPAMLKNELRSVMEEYIGSKRNAIGLSTAVTKIAEIHEKAKRIHIADRGLVCNKQLTDALELRNMIRLAELIAESALFRKETRGHHIRTDFPETLHEWECHTCVQKDRGIGREPVTKV
ncbi:MAG: FAD-binding protein [Synergistes sp.]|nr:FAD-binding protein [Synergistes sp.]